MKYPLIPLCIAFSLGIVAAGHLQITFNIFYLLALFFLIISTVFIKRNIVFGIFILCAAFFLGTILLRNSQALTPNHIFNYTPFKSEIVQISGTVDSDPIQRKKNTSFILRAKEFKKDKILQKVNGRVLVNIFSKDKFFYGDNLVLKGSLYRPFSFSKRFNYRDYLKHRGIYSVIRVKKDNPVKRLGNNVGNPLKYFAYKARSRLKTLFNKNLSSFSASIMNAIILGEREYLSSEAKEALIRTGSVHIISISGLHLGIAAFISLVILKLLRIPNKQRYFLTILFLILYCILTGARVPVLRATVMAVILLFGYLIDRESNIYNSLALAALIILMFNPWQLFEVSFQLSFLSVISIVWLTPKIKSFFPEKFYSVRWARFLIITFSVSTAAWLGLLGLIAYYFGAISPIAILANMMIVPYMPIIVASGFSLVLVSLLAPPLVSQFAASTEVFIFILFKIAHRLSIIPGAFFKIPQISFSHVLLYYAIIIAVFSFLHQKQKL